MILNFKSKPLNQKNKELVIYLPTKFRVSLLFSARHSLAQNLRHENVKKEQRTSSQIQHQWLFFFLIYLPQSFSKPENPQTLNPLSTNLYLPRLRLLLLLLLATNLRRIISLHSLFLVYTLLLFETRRLRQDKVRKTGMSSTSISVSLSVRSVKICLCSSLEISITTCTGSFSHLGI